MVIHCGGHYISLYMLRTIIPVVYCKSFLRNEIKQQINNTILLGEIMGVHTEILWGGPNFLQEKFLEH